MRIGARRISKVFFTYLERASLLGLLFALVPHRKALMTWDDRLQPELWSWQFLLAIIGAVVLAGPILVEITVAMLRAAIGPRSPKEGLVRIVVVVIVGSTAIMAIGIVTISVADLLANLVG